MANAKHNRRTFSRWLDITMDNEGLTGAELARRSNLDEGSISRWRHGRGRPGLESCERLADALDVDPRRLAVTAGLLTERMAGAPPLPIPPATALVARVRHKLEELPGVTSASVEEMLKVFEQGLIEDSGHDEEQDHHNA